MRLKGSVRSRGGLAGKAIAFAAEVAPAQAADNDGQDGAGGGRDGGPPGGGREERGRLASRQIGLRAGHGEAQ